MGTDKVFAPSGISSAGIFSAIFNLDAHTLDVYFDNSHLGTTDYTNAPNQASNKLNLFANRGATAHPDGFVGEFLFFDHSLSPAEQEKLNSYLQTKWKFSDNGIFSLDENGSLFSKEILDHEEKSSYSIQVLAQDPKGAIAAKNFSVSVLNDQDDIDEDGITNILDSDRDGDGLSNTEETANGSDPDDPNSVNYPPTNIISNQQLAFEENQAIGSVIASLIAEDRDQTDSHLFSLVSGEGSSHNHLFNLSADGKLKTESIFDFENNANVFTLRVRVTDKGNLSYEKPLSISLLDSDVFSPLTLDSNLMLWLDAMNRSSLDQGEFLGELGIPEDGDQVKFWSDKSGKEYAKSIEAATYKSEEVLGNPTVYFQNNTFEVQDRRGF